MSVAGVAKTIHVKGMLKDVPKVISYRGQSYEQAMGTHTLNETRRHVLRYVEMYPHEKHIIVKSLNEDKYHPHLGEQPFYWIYSRRR